MRTGIAYSNLTIQQCREVESTLNYHFTLYVLYIYSLLTVDKLNYKMVYIVTTINIGLQTKESLELVLLFSNA